jgi:NADH dehydrogenase [ubiquinone] 1 alpha subcomplex assembly factor 7
MTLGHYMDLCLSHHEHGYYRTRDPLGRQGDFTTAPEVSQLFGEMIGVWLADAWVRLGSPNPCILLEAGPGRGTLMADILRATKNVGGFHDAVQIHLLETSPALKQKQKESLTSYQVQWHNSLDTMPMDMPVLFVANEFLDALPIEQLQYDAGEWKQRTVEIDDDNALRIGLKWANEAVRSSVDYLTALPQDGDILEAPLISDEYCAELGFLMRKQRGAGLFIDYGYEETALGDTLQAVQAHQPVSIFHQPGMSDLTAHVNFERAAVQLSAVGLHATSIVTQKTFLETLGIETRLNALLAQASDQQANDLRSGYDRLTRPDAMGALFKVMGFTSEPEIVLSGF